MHRSSPSDTDIIPISAKHAAYGEEEWIEHFHLNCINSLLERKTSQKRGFEILKNSSLKRTLDALEKKKKKGGWGGGIFKKYIINRRKKNAVYRTGMRIRKRRSMVCEKSKLRPLETKN